jgi:hypothetical protein
MNGRVSIPTFVVLLLVLLLGAQSASAVSRHRRVFKKLLVRWSHSTPAEELQPWIIIKDPNPPPSIDALEESVDQKDIDALVNRLVGSEPGVLIQRFRPYPGWLWRQWFGTVLFHTFPTAIWNMGVTLVFCLIMRHRFYGDWDVWTSITPPPGLFPRMEATDKIWKTLMSLATFLLTFFVGQAYSFWRNLNQEARGIQGRVNDINMLLASSGAAIPRKSTSKNEYYTEEALAFLNSLATKLQVCHLLFWAANVPRFRVLLTPRGLNRLVEVGYLPQSLKSQVLDATVGLAPTSKWTAVLESALMEVQEGIRNPRAIKYYSHALEQTLLDQFCRLRGHMATIPDMVDGRMPLAYAHFVQILVDMFLVVAPVAQ